MKTTFFAVATFVCLLTTSLVQAMPYTVIDLGTLGGTESYFYAINDSGQVVGDSWLTGDTEKHAFISDGTTMTDLGTLGGDHSNARAINNSGLVVGQSYISTGNYGTGHAFISDGTTMTDLGTLGGAFSSAIAINDSGRVAGNSWVTDSTESQPSKSHAFISDGTTMADLGTLGGSFSSAYAINASGQVAGGSVITGNAGNHAFISDGTTMTDLGTLGGNSEARAINDSGLVVGHSGLTGNTTWHAFISDGTTMTDLGTLGGARSNARAINNSGLVVGTSTITGDTEDHAFISDGSSMWDLNDLSNSASFGITLRDARDINELGQIAALGDVNGGAHAFLLNPEWDGIVTPANSYLTDSLTLGDTFTFEYWWEMGMEPTDFNFDFLWFNGTQWETFGWALNFDGNSDGWNSASFYVPSWAQGNTAEIRFQLFDLGQQTDPTVYLRNIKSAPIPEPTTAILFGTGLIGLTGIGRRRKK